MSWLAEPIENDRWAWGLKGIHGAEISFGIGLQVRKGTITQSITNPIPVQGYHVSWCKAMNKADSIDAFADLFDNGVSEHERMT